MIDRLTARSAILLAVLSILFVGLVGWFALVSPQRSKAASLGTAIAAMEVRLDFARRLKRNDEPDERLAQFRRLETAMPQQVAIPEVVRQLSAAARSAGVRIDGVTPSPPTSQGSYQAVPISLRVDGHYFGIANFLQLLRPRAEAEADGEQIRATGRLYSVDSIAFGASASG
nr:type 4a pilus biogenesis protein PilO [Actinomycetota bacterium]